MRSGWLNHLAVYSPEITKITEAWRHFLSQSRHFEIALHDASVDGCNVISLIPAKHYCHAGLNTYFCWLSGLLPLYVEQDCSVEV